MSDKLSEQQLVERLHDGHTVKTGVVYRHIKSGGRYVCVMLALEEATLEPMVVYAPVGDGALLDRSVAFTRPVKEFEEKFERW